MDISGIYISLVVSYLKKEIGETEKKKLFEWVYNKPENEKLFYNLKDIWETAEYEKVSESAQTNEEWEKFILTAIKEESESHLRRKVSMHHVKKVLQIAALIIVTFGVGFLANKFIPQKKEFTTINVPYGAKSQVELPDGSKVTINSGSTLKYPTNMKNREVDLFLEGEAYFDIVHTPNRKLNVNTSTLKIQVLGTAFNVKSYEDEDIVETTLVRGAISIMGKVGNKSIEHPILLKPNQQATLIKNSQNIQVTGIVNDIDTLVEIVKEQEGMKSSQPALIITGNVDVDDFTSWKNNKLVFKSERFEDLAVKMERWYNVEIKLEDESLKNSLYTGTFEKETIEQAMQALSLSLPFKFEINKNQIKIKKRL